MTARLLHEEPARNIIPAKMSSDKHNGFSLKTIAAACISGPGLVTLVPLAAAPAMTAMAKAFYPHGGGAFFAQMVMTMPSVALVLAAPVVGYCTERFGPRPVLLSSLLLYLAGGLSALLAPSVGWLLLGRLLLGIAGAGVLTCSLTLIGRYFEGHMRETVLGLGVSLASAFGAIALSGGGRLADLFGWRGPFALYLLAAPVFLTVFVVIRPPYGKSASSDASTDQAPIAWRQLLPVSPYLALLTAFTLGMFTPSIQGPFLLQDEGITSAAVGGSIISACSVVAIFSAASYGRVRRYLDVPSMLLLTAASFGVGAFLMGALPGAWTAIGSAVMGIGAGTAEATTASAILRRAAPNVQGRALGLMVSFLFLGQWFNPLVFAPLRLELGMRGALFVVGTGFLLLAAGLAINLTKMRLRSSVSAMNGPT